MKRIPRPRGAWAPPTVRQEATLEKRRRASETALARLRADGPLRMRELAEADLSIYTKLWKLGDMERNCRIHGVLEDLRGKGLVRRKGPAWEAV